MSPGRGGNLSQYGLDASGPEPLVPARRRRETRCRTVGSERAETRVVRPDSSSAAFSRRPAHRRTGSRRRSGQILGTDLVAGTACELIFSCGGPGEADPREYPARHRVAADDGRAVGGPPDDARGRARPFTCFVTCCLTLPISVVISPVTLVYSPGLPRTSATAAEVLLPTLRRTWRPVASARSLASSSRQSCAMRWCRPPGSDRAGRLGDLLQIRAAWGGHDGDLGSLCAEVGRALVCPPRALVVPTGITERSADRGHPGEGDDLAGVLCGMSTVTPRASVYSRTGPTAGTRVSSPGGDRREHE